MSVVSTSGKYMGQAADCVILLEDLEFAFPLRQLKEIADLWNAGSELPFLAKKFKRSNDEIFLALFHLARQGKIIRPIAALMKGVC